MDSYNFVIDFENGNINILKLGYGIVLSEPAIAIVSTRQKNDVVQVGLDAVDYVGKLDKSFEVVKPIAKGRIVDLGVATKMLDIFLSDLEEKKFYNRRDIIFLVPCGATQEEREQYMSLGYSLSAKKVLLIPKEQAINLMDDTKSKLAQMVVIVGIDTIDIAIIYRSMLIKGYTIDLGANIIVDSINNHIASNNGIEIDESVLQEIYSDMATILPNDNYEEFYMGKDSYSGSLVKFEVDSSTLRPYYTNFVSEVADIIETVLKRQDSSILAQINVAGIKLAGVINDITGLKKFLSNRLGVEIEGGQYSAIMGISTKLMDIDTLDKLSIK